jgi:hypothetical protein
VTADTEYLELPRPLHLLRIDASALWLRSVLRRLGFGFRSASATTA